LEAAGYNREYTIEESKKVVSLSLEFADHQKKVKRILPLGYSRDMLVTIQALEPGHCNNSLYTAAFTGKRQISFEGACS
jgi:hypothetical protein